MLSKTLLTSVMVLCFAFAGTARAHIQQVLAAAYSAPSQATIVVDGFRYRVEFAHIQRRPDSQVVTGRILFLPVSGRPTTIDYRITQRNDRIVEVSTSPIGPGRLLTVLQKNVSPGVLSQGTWQTVARYMIAHVALNIPARPAPLPRPPAPPKKTEGRTATFQDDEVGGTRAPGGFTARRGATSDPRY